MGSKARLELLRKSHEDVVKGKVQSPNNLRCPGCNYPLEPIGTLQMYSCNLCDHTYILDQGKLSQVTHDTELDDPISPIVIKALAESSPDNPVNLM